MTCAQCGAAFASRPRGRAARFCSARCRGRWHADRRRRLLGELAETLAQAAALARELRENGKA